MKNGISGGPEHQSQAMSPVRAENDEICADLLGQLPNFDGWRTDDYVYCTVIDTVAFY